MSVTVRCPDCGYSNTYRSQAQAEQYLARHSCRRHRDERARLAAAHARAVARTIASDCTHTRVHHEHGTREAYVLDRCRCRACGAANTTAELDRRRAITYGRWNPHVCGDVVRGHLARLTRAGIGYRQVARLSGVHYSLLTRLVWGEPSRGRRPSERVRCELAERILAVDVDAANLAPGGRIDATGTRRRLQALITLGWSQAELARRLGRGTNSLRGTITASRVTSVTAAAVHAVYEHLWNTAPDESTAARADAAATARAHARQHGWLAPLAWDDIDTDPEPQPPATAAMPPDVDELDIEIAIDRLTAGQRVRLSMAERDEVIRVLTDRGHSLEQIACWLDVCVRTVSRRRTTTRAA